MGFYNLRFSNIYIMNFPKSVMRKGVAIKISILVIILSITLIVMILTYDRSDPTVSSIEIKNFAFNPSTISVNVGTTITWVNDDSTMHDVTEDSGMFDIDILPGESGSYTFTEPGEYEYHCDIHPSMKGKVIVG